MKSGGGPGARRKYLDSKEKSEVVHVLRMGCTPYAATQMFNGISLSTVYNIARCNGIKLPRGGNKKGKTYKALNANYVGRF